MSKRTIDHHYSIEYIHPASSTATTAPKKKPKGWLLITTVVIFSLLAGIIFSNDNLSRFFKTFSSAKLLKTDITNSDVTSSSQSSNKNDSVNDSDIKTFTITLDKKQKESVSKPTATENDIKKKTANHSEVKISNVSADEVIVKKPLTEKNNKQIEAPKNDSLGTNYRENDALINSLDQLTEQLASERQNNIQLENKLKDTQGKNDKLAALLSKSTKKESSDTKNYLSAIQKLQKEEKDDSKPIEVVNNTTTKTEIPYISGTQSVLTKKIQDSKTIAVEANEKLKKNLNYNNAISLTTRSQMDAIILAMKSGIKTSRPYAKTENKIKSTPETKNTTGLQSQNNDLISQLSQQMRETSSDKVTETKDDDLVSVDLKGKINQLIESKHLTGANYKQALQQESKARSNAIRSIVVKKGETLWSIAKRAYGDGKHYKKILKANPQLTRKRKLFLVIGQVIRVPK